MFEDDDYLPSPLPFWFASSELLVDLYRAELTEMSRLLSENLELPRLFDAPEATPVQRSACFVLLAHRKLAETAEETLLGRQEQPPSLGDVESNALYRNLVASDAPEWVLEMNRLVALLPFRILEILPEPLRRQGFDRSDDSAQLEAMQSFSTVKQIQTFTEGVLDQQLQRLMARWSPSIANINQPRPDQPSVKVNFEKLNGQTDRQTKRKARRTQDKKRVLRDKLIAEIDDIAETIPEFLQLMDKRKVKPLPTWSEWWPGSWVLAYKDPHFRALIHKDKSRALARVHTGRIR